jgi:hypothetical protein
MMDEPRKHRVFLLLMAVTSIGAVPFAFIGRDNAFVMGLPVWLWSSLGFTVALAALTTWGLLAYWKDDDE